MKLHKRLTVSGTQYQLIDSRVDLGLFSPGRAVFTIESTTEVTGLVVYSVGYDLNNIKRWFVGFVEKSTHVNSLTQRIFCRELSAVLYYRLPMALRDVSLTGVLGSISQTLDIQFLTPQASAEYLSLIAPAFYSGGSGYYAMDSLASVFGIAKPIWQQDTDGRIFVGSWDHSRYANKPVVLSRKWEIKIGGANECTLQAAPPIRPGVLYNGSVITSVIFSGSEMQLMWSKNPWSERC